MPRTISSMDSGFTSANRQVLGTIFRSCLISDIDSLKYYAGVHEKEYGYHRALSKRFPFGIYYSCDSERLVVIAVLDLRSNPLWIHRRIQG